MRHVHFLEILAMIFRSMGRGLSLRLSLLLFLVIPLLAVLAVAGYFSLQHLEVQVEKRMQEDIELIARAIRGPLEHALEHGREGSLEQTLSSAFRIGRVYGAYVYNEQGRKIATSGPREPRARSRHLVELAAGDRIGAYQEADGKEIYSYFVPLSDSVGRNTGLLQLTREGSDIRQYIQDVRQQALILLLILSVVLPAVVVYGHHRVIGRNLGRLVRSMARIEGGERGHRATLSGPREFHHLAAGMNAMLDSISRSEEKLARQREERAHLERQLQQSQKMAGIGQLSAGVAHELGTPLSVVSGKAQRMLRHKDLSVPVRQVFDEIRAAVQRMEHIVRQLLDFGRSNRLSLRLISLKDLAECAAAQMRDEALDKGVTLRLEGPDSAPLVDVDPVRMEQALSNLLRNAVHAVEQGGKVRLTWFADEQRLGFCVADSGPGVPKEIRPRLFEPFFTTKAVGEGTGLGLAVALAAANDHDAQLEVGTSDLGGALFTMAFEPTSPTRT
jgi:two-component system, NtrC family, sensor kinase